MASFSNFVSFLFFTTLLLSLQITNARDSQFFSKVTHANNNNGRETELPNKEESINKPEQEPVFIPETDNSYGLYGHESGQFPHTTTTTTAAATTTANADPYTTTATSYEPYKTESEEEDTSKYPNNNYYYNKDAYNTKQSDLSNTRIKGTGYYFNKDAYERNQKELGNPKYTEGGYNSMSNLNNNQKYYSNNANNDRYYYNNNAANSGYNGERQGMSDTRFMEAGKYYYNVESEKYNPTLYGGSSRGVNSKNWYNNRGYFGNNNANSYENNNSMEGYQNQEFEGNKEDFEP